MNKHGLTLIEVLVSIALIGTIFVIFGASLASLHSHRYIENENIAYSIAEAEIESIRLQEFASTTNRTDAPFIGITSEHSAWELLNEGEGLLTVEDWGGNESIKLITTEVRWVDDRGTRSVELQTLISE